MIVKSFVTETGLAELQAFICGAENVLLAADFEVLELRIFAPERTQDTVSNVEVDEGTTVRPIRLTRAEGFGSGRALSYAVTIVVGQTIWGRTTREWDDWDGYKVIKVPEAILARLYVVLDRALPRL